VLSGDGMPQYLELKVVEAFQIASVEWRLEDLSRPVFGHQPQPRVVVKLGDQLRASDAVCVEDGVATFDWVARFALPAQSDELSFAVEDAGITERSLHGNALIGSASLQVDPSWPPIAFAHFEQLALVRGKEVSGQLVLQCGFAGDAVEEGESDVVWFTPRSHVEDTEWPVAEIPLRVEALDEHLSFGVGDPALEGTVAPPTSQRKRQLDVDCRPRKRLKPEEIPVPDDDDDDVLMSSDIVSQVQGTIPDPNSKNNSDGAVNALHERMAAGVDSHKVDSVSVDGVDVRVNSCSLADRMLASSAGTMSDGGAGPLPDATSNARTAVDEASASRGAKGVSHASMGKNPGPASGGKTESPGPAPGGKGPVQASAETFVGAQAADPTPAVSGTIQDSVDKSKAIPGLKGKPSNKKGKGPAPVPGSKGKGPGPAPSDSGAVEVLADKRNMDAGVKGKHASSKGKGKPPIPGCKGKGPAGVPAGKGTKQIAKALAPVREDRNDWATKKKPRLQWKRLLRCQDIVGKSLFSEELERDGTLDCEALAEHFVVVEGQKPACQAAGSASEGSIPPRAEKPVLWEATERVPKQRLQNFAVVMKTWKNPDAFLNHLSNFDFKAILDSADFSEDRFEQLVAQIASITENDWARLREEGAKDTYQWDEKVEGFFARLQNVHLFAEMFEVMRGHIVIKRGVSNLSAQAQKIADAMRAIHQSEALRTALRKLLHIGNYLNAGVTHLGRADGFDVILLLEKTILNDMPRGTGGTSLLQYLRSKELSAEDFEGFKVLAEQLIDWKLPTGMADEVDAADVTGLLEECGQLSRDLVRVDCILSKITSAIRSCSTPLLVPQLGISSLEQSAEIEGRLHIYGNIINSHRMRIDTLESDLDSLKQQLPRLQLYLGLDPEKEKGACVGRILGVLGEFARRLAEGSPPALPRRRRRAMQPLGSSDLPNFP